MQKKVIEPIGFIIAALTLLFSFFLFHHDSSDTSGSIFAALIAAGLAWSTYIILRWFYLAIRL